MGAILEMIIALVALAIGTVTVIRGEVEQHRAQILTGEGQFEAILNNALAEYSTVNLQALSSGTAVTGFANALAPTIAELATNKYLVGGNYRAGPFWGGTYVTQITVGPVGCQTSVNGCQVSSLLYPSLPLKRKGLPDVAGAGIVAAAGGPLFGFSNVQTPAIISGLNGEFTTTNPLVGTPAAAIVALNGSGTDGGTVYIRRDGGVTWTGNQNVNGVNLNNVGTINAQTVAAADVMASAVAVANTTGEEIVGLGTAAVLHEDAPDQIFLESNNGTVITNTAGSDFAPLFSGAITSNSTINGTDITASGLVSASNLNVNANASSCTSDQVSMRGASLMFVCNKEGAFVGISTLVGNLTTDAKFQGQVNGSAVVIPSCAAGGTPWFSIIPSSYSTDYATNPPVGGGKFSIVQSGADWVLQIDDVLADGNNTLVADTLGLQAEIDVGCAFSND